MFANVYKKLLNTKSQVRKNIKSGINITGTWNSTISQITWINNVRCQLLKNKKNFKKKIKNKKKRYLGLIQFSNPLLLLTIFFFSLNKFNLKIQCYLTKKMDVPNQSDLFSNNSLIPFNNPYHQVQINPTVRNCINYLHEKSK